MYFCPGPRPIAVAVEHTVVIGDGETAAL